MAGVLIIGLGIVSSFMAFGFWGGIFALFALMVILNIGR